MARMSPAQRLTGWPPTAAEWLRREVDLSNMLEIQSMPPPYMSKITQASGINFI